MANYPPFGIFLEKTMPNAETKLLSSTAMKTTVDDLTAQYERASGRKLVTAYAPSAPIAKRIADGETGDLELIADFIHTRRR